MKRETFVSDVNRLLKTYRLSIFRTVRGHQALDVSTGAKTLAERDALVSKLMLEKIVSDADPVKIPPGFLNCFSTGGALDENGRCFWTDDKVDFTKVLADKKAECSRVKGEYKEFGGTCVDSCESASNLEVLCGAAMTMGCDCGPDRCWHRGTCIQNPKSLPLSATVGDLNFQYDPLDLIEWELSRGT